MPGKINENNLFYRNIEYHYGSIQEKEKRENRKEKRKKRREKRHLSGRAESRPQLCFVLFLYRSLLELSLSGDEGLDLTVI